jgi:hypothetical protein
MSVKPTSASSVSIRPGAAKANIPGAPGSGSGAPARRRTSSPAIETHGLSCGGPQAASATRPSGRSTRRVSRSAAPGSAMSM